MFTPPGGHARATKATRYQLSGQMRACARKKLEECKKKNREAERLLTLKAQFPAPGSSLLAPADRSAGASENKIRTPIDWQSGS